MTANFTTTLEWTDVRRAVERALPSVRDSREEIEQRRRLPDAVVTALRETGINRLALPAALGGFEAPVTDAVRVFEQIAAADGSAGWCAVIGAGSNLFAGYLPESGARDVFADPDQGSATMFAPLGTIEADHRPPRLRGRWPFVSNCLHSTWIGVGASMRHADETDPVPRLVFVRADDVSIEDRWDVAGLRGTGSHHIRADDVVVDADHTCTFLDRPWPDGPLWRMPLFSVILPMLAAVPLGIARGALDEIIRQAREGRDARRGQLGEEPLAMADFAAADARLRAARAGLLDAVEEAEEVARTGRSPGRHLLARLHLAHLHAADTAVEITSVAHRLGGGGAVYHRSPLLRALGDVEAARQHLQFAHEHRIRFGRVLAGVDLTYPPYIT